MKTSLKNSVISKNSIDTRELSIALFVLLVFTVQFFSHILRSNSLLILALLGVGFLGLSLNAHRIKTHPLSSSLWLAALVIVALSILRPSAYMADFSINKYVDLFVFFAGIALLLISGDESKSFRAGTKIILFFAVFYAISVWIQILLPSFYEVFLRFMSESSRQNILGGAESGYYFTGFASNAGFTAGYIICGIIILSTKNKNIAAKKSTKISLLLLLFLSLFMTGRRAHTIFLLAALAGIYVFPYKKRKFFRRMGAVIASLVLLLLVLVLFQDFLMRIPFFSRMNWTIGNLATDVDISSGRSDLYDHAWKLFLANPWFGIGWGNFHYTTIGTVTVNTAMEAHNVYLQLLCEIGILGSLLVMIPIVSMFIQTLLGIRKLRTEDKEAWFPLLSYSLAYQVFFLLYGLTGNPFFEPIFLMMYFFSGTITTAYLRFCKEERSLENAGNENIIKPLKLKDLSLAYSERKNGR